MRIRKTLSLILALVMCLSLAVPAFAAETNETEQVATDCQVTFSVDTISPMSGNIDGLNVITDKIQANTGSYTKAMWKNTNTEYRVFINQGSLPTNLAIDVIMNGRSGMLYQCEDFLNGFNGSRVLVLGADVTDVYVRFRGKNIIGNMNHDSYFLNFAVEKI